MLKKLVFGFLCIISLLTISCQEDLDDVIVPSSTLDINDFVYQAMFTFYFYKSEVPDLANDRFSSNTDYINYLSEFSAPEILFENILFEEDRFSIIVEDYRVLESNSQGLSLSNGMRFGLVRIEDTSQVFGYVRYVVPNSPAESAGLERGIIFTQVNGVSLTDTNFIDLLSPQQYSIGLAELQNGQLELTGQTVDLTKIELVENPIHIAQTLDVDGQNIGYLMYNAFRSNFQAELNDVFGGFQADGVTDLVLDLRYNGGGSVETAKDLCSMITGQFNGQLFAVERFNENFQDPDVELFFDNTTANGQSINSLNLNRVYILTSGSSASASELVINALNPYIDVIQIGTNTVGKFQGSTILYDSPEFFNKQNININHFYALQPLIFEIENAVGFSGFEDGLVPDIQMAEDFFNLGVLGDTAEPLLNRALVEIGAGLQDDSPRDKDELFNELNFKIIGESGQEQNDFQRMYDNSINTSILK
jgi:C-terminal processing protease CtpA/Prc